MKNKVLTIIFTGLLSISLFSCKEEKTEDFGSLEQATVLDNQLAENTSSEILNIVEQAGKYGNTYYKSGQGILSNCAVITHDQSSFPKVLTIDFGTTNCLCNDGKNRRGKIIATHTGEYNETGTVISVSFNQYFVNDYQVTGNKTITNMGENSGLDPWFSVMANITITNPGGGEALEYSVNRSRTWIEGDNTPNLLDDVYLIEGTSTGSRPSGGQFVVSILQALRKEVGCPQFVSGQLRIDRTNKPSIDVDYGTGDCDGQVNITINGNTFPFGI